MILFGVTLEQAEKMTMREYSFNLYAYEKRYIEKVKMIDLQAWQNNQVKATKKRGKTQVPYYDSFEEFSQAYKIENNIEKTTNKDNTLNKLLLQANK